jgi:alkanesulfonate monooxygenase SsuD/methylene tetrahydromethanopterin reductase-like flavin-dependent oxidoreductase (luciferase family)/alkylation response protein AidB-like acyl-CoA dehydrogenase
VTRQLILNVNVLDFGQTISAREFSGLPAALLTDADYYVGQARAAERGTLDALFLADGPALAGDPRGRGARALEPSLILTAIAASTSHLGVIGTLSTTYNDPVELADRLLTLDHVSGGRAAWNAVTTYSPPAAANFGLPGQPDRTTRYRRANEFIDVVLALWQGAVDGTDLRHDGEFFHVSGRLPLGASPQGYPVLLQAGGSPQGRELAGRTAGGVFTAELTLDAGVEHYELVKQAAVRHGRGRGDLTILPGLITVVGSTHAEAEERLARTRELLPRDHETARLSGMLGYDLRGVGLDDPFPADALGELADPQAFSASLGFRESLVRALSQRPYTFREVLDEFGNGGHRRIVGSPEEVADTLEEWFKAGAADGFNLMPDAFPSGLDDFVDQVVPVLRARGLFRHEYQDKTLRQRWGLKGADADVNPTSTAKPRYAQVVPDDLTVEGIRAAVQPVLDRLRATAIPREESRDYAFEEVRRLAEAGFLLIAVPRADGGAGGTLRDLLDLVITIARADSSLAQALRGSFSAAWSGTGWGSRDRAETLAKLQAGHLFAGTTNERTGGPGGTITTTLHRVGDELVLTGEKYYSTGGLYADWFGGTARAEDGKVARFSVPTGRDGVERLDDFDAIGQRLSASGTTRLASVRLSADEVDLGDGPAPENPWGGGIAHLYLCAVQAGIAQAVLDDAVWFARERGRPIKHSSAVKSVDDPYIQRAVGQIAALAHAARSSVLIAGEMLESVNAAPNGRVRAAGAQASVVVAQTQAFVADAALKAAELLFDVGGGSATASDLGFDRHWRNARTVANHNPRDWKLAKAGVWHLTGEEPPTSGLF